MTHDELLSLINKAGAEAFQSESNPWIALRAVVELHKPVTHKSGQVFCSANCEGHYPCDTTKTIEKQLK